MITVKSFLGLGQGWKEQPFDNIVDAIKAFDGMDPCHEMPRICRDGKTVAEHDVESGMAIIFWADDVKKAWLTYYANKLRTDDPRRKNKALSK